jgi:hypothetical protein
MEMNYNYSNYDSIEDHLVFLWYRIMNNNNNNILIANINRSNSLILVARITRISHYYC